MLYLDQPIYIINGLQIHRDFQNPNQYYYFPNAPRIHYRDGVPALQLLKYARDLTDNPALSPEAKEQIGGAFLTFTVDLGVDDAILTDTKSQLAAYTTGEIALVPVQFHSGTVRLLALGAQADAESNAAVEPADTFIETIYGSTKPTLYGDNLAIFGLHLTREGATLLEDSLRHGGGLLGVIYDLSYTGIRPALQVKARVDYHRIYNHFEANLQFQYAMIGAEIGAQLQWLAENGAIEIEITQYDPDPNLVAELRKEAMTFIQQEILSKMFKPSLAVPQSLTNNQGSLMEQVMRYANQLRGPVNPNSADATDRTNNGPATNLAEGAAGPSAMTARSDPQSGSNGSGTSGSSPGFALTFSLKYLRQEERKSAEFDFRVNQAVNRTAAPQGSLHTLFAGVDLNNHIREVNLDDPFFRALDARIGVTGDWERLGIDHVIVNATYQPNPLQPIVHTDGWSFTGPNIEPKRFTVLLDKHNPIRSYHYKTEVLLTDRANVDSKYRVLTVENVSTQRELLINPANELRPLLITVEPGEIDFIQVPRVDLFLRYEDAGNDFVATQRFTMHRNDDGPFTWVLFPVNPEVRTYQVTYGYTLRNATGDTTYVEIGPEERTDEGITVPPPFRGTRRVYVTPAVDPEAIREISVEVAYQKARYTFQRLLYFTADNLATQVVDIPIPDPDPATDTYKARWSILTNHFESIETDWTEFQSARLLIDDGVYSVLPVRVELWEPPAYLDLSTVRIMMESLNPAGNVVDTDQQILQGEQQSATFYLLYEKATPFRYRIRYSTRAMNGALQYFGPEEGSNPELFLDLSSSMKEII